jgi:ribosomal-protein-serine acetyltransferase
MSVAGNRPVEPLQITEGSVLRPYVEGDAAELTEVVAANREHLARWMPWAASYGYEDGVEYIASAIAKIEADAGFEGAIVLDGKIVGGAGCHQVDWLNRTTAIGYWLASDAQGRGLMTATVRALLDHAFGTWELHRVVIEVVVDNERSKAIPERLGFRQEAVLREAKLIGGRFEDALLYAMVASDWSASPAREAIGSE